MADFVESVGLPLFAHRLRRLSEALVDSLREWRPEAGVTAPPKASSTLLLLLAVGPLAVTQIAARLKLTHPLIIQLTRELGRLGLVEVNQDPDDGRRRLVSLTPAGKREAENVKKLHRAVDTVYREIFSEIDIDAYAAVAEVERALKRRSLVSRLNDLKATQPAGKLETTP